jgi:hypothetical protein
MTRDEWERMPWPAREHYVRRLNQQLHEAQRLLEEARAERERVARIRSDVRAICISPTLCQQSEEQAAPWLTRRRANALAARLTKDSPEQIQQRIEEWMKR